jgi:hypothetical protein
MVSSGIGDSVAALGFSRETVASDFHDVQADAAAPAKVPSQTENAPDVACSPSASSVVHAATMLLPVPNSALTVSEEMASENFP